MFTKIERLISYRYLKPKKKEGFLKTISIFSFFGIMLGVAILIIVMSIMNGFRTDLTKKILGLNPHVFIQPSSSNISENFLLDVKKKYKESKIQKVLDGEGIIITKEKNKGTLIKGIIKDQNGYEFLNNKMIEGAYESFEKGNIIIGAEAAFDLSLNIGDKISLMSSKFISTPFGNLPEQSTYKVSGIYRTGFYEFDKNIIFLTFDDALALLGNDEKSFNLEIFLNEPLKADKVKIEIQNQNNDLFVYSWTDLNKSFFSALKVERNVMFIILTLIIIVAAFNIISGLTILIKNKTKEIAILKILGMSNLSIQKTFFLTGFSIGFLATVFGVLIGTLFSLYVEEIRQVLSNLFNVNIFPSDVYILDELPSEINIISVLYVSFSSLLITIIASIIPAKSISKMELSKTLKYE